jgi:hypothetical protein
MSAERHMNTGSELALLFRAMRRESEVTLVTLVSFITKDFVRARAGGCAQAGFSRGWTEDRLDPAGELQLTERARERSDR